MGPVLFFMFINDIDFSVDVSALVLSKFADDTKWGKILENEEGQKLFEEGINSLVQWSNAWQMEFNVDKCHIMHIGPRNKEYQYTMGGEELKSSEYEKDLGVLIQQNLRQSQQCAKAVKTANMVLGQISRAVSYRDKVTFPKLFCTYVRPQ